MNIRSARFVVYASDVSVSYQFYTDVLGLQVVDRVVGGTVLAAGAIEIELLQERRDEEIGLDRRTGLLIFVDDADAAYSQLLERDAVLLTEIATGADGARSFYIADPDGLPIGIVAEAPAALPPAAWLYEEQ
jgi:catechol 2,3-dioxygenase-like lactoylglutathione lyase family enzyme